MNLYRELLRFPPEVKFSIRNRGGKFYVSARGAPHKVLRMCIVSAFPCASMTSGGGDGIVMRINPEERYHEFYLELNYGFRQSEWPGYITDDNDTPITDDALSQLP